MAALEAGRTGVRRRGSHTPAAADRRASVRQARQLARLFCQRSGKGRRGRMKNTRRKGSVLTLVIVALTLMAMGFLVLAEGAHTMLFQADAAAWQAVQRN